jgi:hypothetical protein
MAGKDPDRVRAFLVAMEKPEMGSIHFGLKPRRVNQTAFWEMGAKGRVQSL